MLQVRNVPQDSRRTLKARAAEQGQSLNSYMLDLIEREVSRPTVAEVFERARKRTERATASAADVLRAERGERERELARRSGA